MPDNDVAVSSAEGRGVRALARGLEILDLFAGKACLTQTEVSSRTGLPMPTVHRLVGTLLQYGYLEIDPALGRSLRAGVAAVRLGAPGAHDAEEAVRVAIHDLSEATGETVNLATLVGSSIVYLDSVSGSRMLTPKAAIGARLPSHCTALGKALLAQLDDAEVLDRLGPGPYDQLTEHTVARWAALRAQLEEVRDSGLAVSDQEFEVGLVSLAVPVSRGDGPLLAVNVSLPSARATATFRAELAERLRVTFEP